MLLDGHGHIKSEIEDGKSGSYTQLKQSRINVLNCKAVETESKPNRCEQEFHLKDLHPNFVMVKTFYGDMVQPYSIGLLDLHILVSSLE